MFGWVRTVNRGECHPVVLMLDLDGEATEDRFLAESVVVHAPDGFFTAEVACMGRLC